MKNRTRLLRWSILIGGTVCALGFGELLGHFFSPQAREIPAGLVVHADGPADRWTLQTGYRGRLKSSEFDVSVQVNHDGLRGPELLSGRDRPRVLILGDSFAFGWGVEEQETFEQVAARQLAATGIPFEALNGGVPGYGPTQEIAQLRAGCAALHPDRIVLAFYAGNDLVDLLKSEVLPPGDAPWHAAQRALHERSMQRYTWGHWLRDRSVLYKIIVGLSQRTCFRLGYCPFVEDPFQPYRVAEPLLPEAVRVLDDALTELQDAASQCGAPLSVVLLPSVSQVEYPDVSGTRVSELVTIESGVSKWAETHRVPLLDLSPVLRDAFVRAPSIPLYFNYDLHFTPAGNRIVGQALAEFLQRRVLPASH
jgi:lysophospholipase L1-like esterase